MTKKDSAQHTKKREDALRVNLLKRKEQARARQANQEKTKSPK